RAATISRPLGNMRAPRVRSTRPHIMPTRSLLLGRPARLTRGERFPRVRKRSRLDAQGPKPGRF
ncbi:hypothetical protein T492DRAFT_1033595, partial [Pavlovales sp. CCMP2436]